MATQSRGGVHRSERFQIHCLKSAVRLERRDKGGSRGVARDRYRRDRERWRAAAPEMQISTFLAAARNSSERLVAAIFNIRVDPLGVRFGN
jgi:hypothetical protein